MRYPITRREAIKISSIGIAGGLAGCSGSSGSGSGSSSSGDSPEPTRGEVIEEFSDTYPVGTYEQPDEPGSIEDYQYLGRGSIPLFMPHTAEVTFEIDLSPQEGYDTIPVNAYFVDADSFVQLRENEGIELKENEEFETVEEGTLLSVEESESASFIIEPGLYYMVLESDRIGRESTFNLDYTSYQYLNYKQSCSDSELNIKHLSLELTDSLLNVESWNIRYHIQYDGEDDTEYNLEVSLISSDSREVITQTQRQIEDCKTNFVYADEESLNVVNRNERIIAEIKVLDNPDGSVLAEATQEIENIVR